MGEKIWESPEAAVYIRSKQPKPTGYPCTFDDPGPGIIFAGYQALGSCQHPLVFCLHGFRKKDRERNSFYRMDVVDVIQKIASRLPPEASARVLLLVKRRWYDRPRKKYDFESWHRFVATLVRNVAASSHLASVWRDEFPDLLVARQVKRSDIPRYNRRRQALDWKSPHRRFRRWVVSTVGAICTATSPPTISCWELGTQLMTSEHSDSDGGRKSTTHGFGDT